MFEKYMKIALDEAKTSLKSGNKGFGAVIIKNDELIAQAHDTAMTDHDPTAHAEMNVIKIASKLLGIDLSDCTIISTHEPCPMCSTAMIWANISKIAFGTTIIDSIKLGRNMINIRCSEIAEQSKNPIEIYEGILKHECLNFYNPNVIKYVNKLRGADDTILENMEKDLYNKRLSWFKENEHSIKNQKGTDLEKAYHLLRMKINIKIVDIPVVSKTDSEIVFRSKNFCPLLEACKILDLDTKLICKKVFEQPTDALVKLINPKLAFTRNYNSIRPYKAFCEESIKLQK
ncbi:MAG: nucleoside deaminase [Candidatus Hodarchaeales archaeon]